MDHLEHPPSVRTEQAAGTCEYWSSLCGDPSAAARPNQLQLRLLRPAALSDHKCPSGPSESGRRPAATTVLSGAAPPSGTNLSLSLESEAARSAGSAPG